VVTVLVGYRCVPTKESCERAERRDEDEDEVKYLYGGYGVKERAGNFEGGLR
jgi:hypothetical protein